MVYSHIMVSGISLGYIISQLIDRGSLEAAGPSGITRTFSEISEQITRIDTGLITTYASYILLAILSLIFICL